MTIFNNCSFMAIVKECRAISDRHSLTISRSCDAIVFRNLTDWVKFRLLLLGGLSKGSVGVNASGARMHTSLEPD